MPTFQPDRLVAVIGGHMRTAEPPPSPPNIEPQYPLRPRVLSDRQRTVHACDKCRERKTKCSGNRPVCQRCISRGLICQYSSRETRPRGPSQVRFRNTVPSSDTRCHISPSSPQANHFSQSQFASHCSPSERHTHYLRQRHIFTHVPKNCAVGHSNSVRRVYPSLRSVASDPHPRSSPSQSVQGSSTSTDRTSTDSSYESWLDLSVGDSGGDRSSGATPSSPLPSFETTSSVIKFYTQQAHSVDLASPETVSHRHSQGSDASRVQNHSTVFGSHNNHSKTNHDHDLHLSLENSNVRSESFNFFPEYENGHGWTQFLGRSSREFLEPLSMVHSYPLQTDVFPWAPLEPWSASSGGSRFAYPLSSSLEDAPRPKSSASLGFRDIALPRLFDPTPIDAHNPFSDPHSGDTDLSNILLQPRGTVGRPAVPETEFPQLTLSRDNIIYS